MKIGVTTQIFSESVSVIVGQERFSIYTRISNQYVVVIHMPDVGVHIEIEERRFLISDEETIVPLEDWNDFMRKIADALHNDVYNRLLADFRLIKEASLYFRTLEPYETTFPSELNGERISIEQLHDTCLPVFVHRLSSCCEAARLLAGSTFESLLGNELAVGILLRTCVLDSILIMGWLAHPELASALAVDSLKRLAKIKGDGPSVTATRTRWQELSSFFNAHNLSDREIKISIDAILDKMPDSHNLREYRHVYEYYSKYDHFSLMPYIINKTAFGYMAIMIMSTHLIKHAFCGMVCIHIPDEQENFENIFSIKVKFQEEGSFIFEGGNVADSES